MRPKCPPRCQQEFINRHVPICSRLLIHPSLSACLCVTGAAWSRPASSDGWNRSDALLRYHLELWPGPGAFGHFYLLNFYAGGTVVRRLARSPHSKKVWDSNLGSGLSVWTLQVLPVHVWVFSGHSDFLPRWKDMLVR